MSNATLFAGRIFAGVIFDMDGTLIDSTPAVVRSWSSWAQEYDVSAAALEGNHGVPAAAIVAKVLEPDRVAEALARIIELEVNDIDGVVPLPGARRALQDLRSVPHAIATSSTGVLASARLRASELEPPDVLITADQVARGKPAPDPFLLAAKRLGVAPTECLVVEDAPQGLIGARAAGCATLAVITTTPRAELIADEVVADLSAVRWLPRAGGVAVAAA